MKTYKSHKTVEAAKIVAVRFEAPFEFRLLMYGPDPLDFVAVDDAWWVKHTDNGARDLVGGYVVSYPGDGYLSWSPAAAFEEGYTEHSLDPKDGALPVAGYKPQNQTTVNVVNGNKQVEEGTLRILDSLKTFPGIDQLWLQTGRTHIEQGWMFVNRAVFQPGRASMPGDPQA